MPTFFYKAADSAGKIIESVMEAEEVKEVVSRLHTQGFIPLRVGEHAMERRSLDLAIHKHLSRLRHRISGKDIMLFTQDLASLLGAGLPVDRALDILEKATGNARLREVIRDILKSIQGGSDLSGALANHPAVFTKLYVNMVRAGEAGGVLEPVLQQLATFLEASQDLKDYIQSAMVYPLFLVLVSGLSIIILLTFVIPKFSIIFSDLGGTIPLATRFLLGVSETLRSYWWAILGVSGLLCFGLSRYAKSPAGRLKLDEYKLKFPVTGNLIQKIEVVKFARTLGTLVKNGVPILQALLLVRDIVGNQVVADSLGSVYDKVKEGERLSKPLEEAGLFPPLAIQIITVGEETGRLDEMLLRVADNYEKAVKNTVKRLISLMEPALILVMGLVVGFIVISMLMAIFSVNEIPF